jgi:hypothetical protein
MNERRASLVVLLIALALASAILVVPVYVSMMSCERWYWTGFVQTSSGTHEIGIQGKIIAYNTRVPFTLYNEEGRSYQYSDVTDYYLHPVIVVTQCPVHAPYHTCEKRYLVGYVETSLQTYKIGPENRTVNYDATLGTTIYLYDEAGNVHAFHNVTSYRLELRVTLMEC